MAEKEPKNTKQTEKPAASSEKSEKKSATTDKKAAAKEVVEKIQKLRGEKLSLKQAQKLARELKISPEEAKKIEVRIEADLEEEKVKARKLIPGLEEEEKKLVVKLEQAVDKPPTESLKANIQQIENLQHYSKTEEEQLVGAVLQVEIDKHEEEHGEISLKVEPKQTNQKVATAEQKVQQYAEQISQSLSPLERINGETDEVYVARVEARKQGIGDAVELITQQVAESKRGAFEASMLSPEQQMEAGYEVPPRLEDGPQESLDWFYGRLQYLEEHFANQSFDSRWQLVSPLEQFILRASRKIGQNLENPITYRGKTFQTYEQLGDSLSDMLEARRSRHNHTYVFRRATGTGDLIGAAAMLDLKNIETLIHIPEVAEKLRQFERIGNEFGQIKDKQEKKEKTTEALNLQESDWSGRIAGGLFSALGESARFDIQINEAGDFFWNRVQNFSTRAESTIRARYQTKEEGGSIDEKTQNELVEIVAPVLDLRTKTFLADTISGAKEKLDDGEFGIKKAKDGSLDLEEFKFEKLNLSRHGENALGLTSNDALKISMLDIDDANGVRKSLWDPGGYLDRLNGTTLAAVYPLMKHLKGAERAGWFKGAIKATVDVNKENWWDLPKPPPLQQSIGKKLFGRNPWGRGRAGLEIDDFRHLGVLSKKEGDGLTDEYMGKSPTRFLRGGFLDILRIFFESLYKAYQAMEKAK